jgi:Domain of unknown function (DUF4123)
VAKVPIERVFERLWPAGPDDFTYAIFDGARNPDVVPLVASSRLPSRCLYVGDIDPALARVAPHLVRLSRTDARAKSLLERAWGESWGIYLRAEAPMDALHRHFRRFLRVRDEDGRRLLFRYYDPRVLRAYLPTCLAPELDYVFGPVGVYVVEGAEADRILEFRNRGGSLATGEVRIEKRLTWLGEYLRKNKDA